MTGERLTAAISAIVAIAILAVAGSGQQAARVPQDRDLARLESDLRFQIDLSHRADGGKRKSLVAALDATLAAWRASPQGESDRRLLLAWLDTALDRAMPGGSDKFPPPPVFGGQPASPRIVPSQSVHAATAVETQSAVAPRHDDRTQTESSQRDVTPSDAASSADVGSAAQPIDAERGEDAPAPVERLIVAISPPEQIPPTAADDAPVFGNHPAPSDSQDATTERSVLAALEAPSGPEVAAAYPGADVPATIEPAAPVSLLVSINVGELNARVGGYHEGLDRIAAALVIGGTPSRERLTSLVEQLERLTVQYRFVSMYFGSLSEVERLRALKPRTMDEAIGLVRRYVDRLEAEQDFLAEFADPSAEPTLAQRLDLVARTAGARTRAGK